MNWKKLHENISEFARKHGIQIEEDDVTFAGGQVTTFQLNENSEIFYQLKHAKPIEEYGSKLRVYSKSPGQLSVNVRIRWMGKPIVKSSIELSNNFRELLRELAYKIGTYQWVSELHQSGWPSELRNSEILKFECKQVEMASTQFELIRQIHIKLLEKNSM